MPIEDEIYGEAMTWLKVFKYPITQDIHLFIMSPINSTYYIHSSEFVSLEPFRYYLLLLQDNVITS